MDMALFHMIRVSNHVSIEAGVNWFPWSNHPSRVAIGWKAEHHDTSIPPMYCYLIPDLEADTPMVNVYIGIHGDPDLDPLLMVLEVT